MHICVHEGIIEQQAPDLLHELDFEELQNGCSGYGAICLQVEVLYCIWELEAHEKTRQ
jgi:hypothetical protein